MFVSHRREKLLNAIVYFAKHTQRCHKLKLFKLLHFLDFEHFRQTGRPSIGLRYEAWPMGPVPHELDDELNDPGLDLRSAVQISTRRDRSTGKALKFTFKPKRSFDPSLFSKRELTIMRELALYFNDFNGEDMSELSHLKGLPWRTVYGRGSGKGHEIPYDRQQLPVRFLQNSDGTAGNRTDPLPNCYRRSIVPVQLAEIPGFLANIL